MPSSTRWLEQRRADQLNQVLLVITITLVGLAAVNTVFITWATALDGRRASALARALRSDAAAGQRGALGGAGSPGPRGRAPRHPGGHSATGGGGPDARSPPLGSCSPWSRAPFSWCGSRRGPCSPPRRSSSSWSSLAPTGRATSAAPATSPTLSPARAPPGRIPMVGDDPVDASGMQGRPQPLGLSILHGGTPPPAPPRRRRCGKWRPSHLDHPGPAGAAAAQPDAQALDDLEASVWIGWTWGIGRRRRGERPSSKAQPLAVVVAAVSVKVKRSPVTGFSSACPVMDQPGPRDCPWLERSHSAIMVKAWTR